MKKIALCYDRINKFGGAERVLQALHELWPDAPVFTLTYSHGNATWAEGWDIRSSFLQRIPFFGHKHELFPALAPLAWEQFNFNEFDVVISITSAEAKCILTAPNTKHICYCLTPTRYLWSGYAEYLQSSGFGFLNGFVKKVFSILSYPLRMWDYYYSQRPDTYVGISDEVCRRIKKYYRRDSVKIYPPVETLSHLIIDTKEEISPYFLVVSRLVPYKKVDIVVEAFNELGWPLKVIGVGSEMSMLSRIAKKNIEFLGFLSDDEISRYYSGCAAVIFPPFEDFGIVPVEAQSFGKPVIAYRGGGALETIIENETGLFFDKQTKESIISLFERCCERFGVSGLSMVNMVQYLKRFDPQKARMNALNFSKIEFQRSMSRVVDETALPN